MSRDYQIIREKNFEQDRELDTEFGAVCNAESKFLNGTSALSDY